MPEVGIIYGKETCNFLHHVSLSLKNVGCILTENVKDQRRAFLWLEMYFTIS